MNFDERAKLWDTEERIKRAEKISNEIEMNIDVNKNMSVMEFGCGTGLISFNLKDKVKHIELIDSSFGMIEMVNEKIEKYQAYNMSAKCIDLLENNIEDKFNLIYSSMVFHHILNLEKILIKLRSLIANGCICIVDLNEEDGKFHLNEKDFKGHNGFNQEKLRDLLIKCGFKNVKSKTFFYGVKNINGEEVPYSLFIMTGQV